MNGVTIQGGNIIIDQQQGLFYLIGVGIVLLAIIIIVVSIKLRRKRFIKTIPTNLKDEEV